MVAVAFLKDNLKYLNELNTKLQRNGAKICDPIQNVFAFCHNMDIFKKL